MGTRINVLSYGGGGVKCCLATVNVHFTKDMPTKNLQVLRTERIPQEDKINFRFREVLELRRFNCILFPTTRTIHFTKAMTYDCSGGYHRFVAAHLKAMLVVNRRRWYRI